MQAVLVASVLHGAAVLLALRGGVRPLSTAAGALTQRPAEEVVIDIPSEDPPAAEDVSAGPVATRSSTDEEPSGLVGGAESSPEEAPSGRREERASARQRFALRARATRPSQKPLEATGPEATDSEPTDSEPTGSEATAAESPPAQGAEGPPSATESAPGAPATALRQGRPSGVDLGLGPAGWTRWMPPSAASGAVARSPGAGTEKPRGGYSTTGGLREALEAHDQELGLGPAGSVLTAARAAAHSEVAPSVGRASFLAVVLRDGTVTVSLESCNSERAGWTKVADVMQRELARRPPSIDAGRNGVRISLDVSAEERWPNGADVKGEAPHVALEMPKIQATDESLEEMQKQNPVAVTDPSESVLPRLKINLKPPGLWLKGRGKVCSYAIGLTPTGLTLSAPCDPSNIGAKATRVVTTRIVKQSPI